VVIGWRGEGSERGRQTEALFKDEERREERKGGSKKN
jgi:hypothetical protein